jgi:hypothetical protein
MDQNNNNKINIFLMGGWLFVNLVCNAVLEWFWQQIAK